MTGREYFEAVVHRLAETRPEILTSTEGRWRGPMEHEKIIAGPVWESRGLAVIVSPRLASDGSEWLAVSFSRAARMPDYADMCEIRARFFRPTDTVLHVWPPVEEHYSLHPYCLHLWTRLDGVRIVPDLRGYGPNGERGV